MDLVNDSLLVTIETLHGSTTSDQVPCIQHGRRFGAWWYRLLLTLVCSLGVIGNILNLLVLTRHKMVRALDRLERSVTHLLVAMACSDMGYCLVLLPSALYSDDFNWYIYSERFVAYYKVYCEHLQDVFMIISAWLIVILSVNRYIVVVHPLRAQVIISGSCTAAGVCSVVVLGLLATIPNFLYLAFSQCITPSGEHAVSITKGLSDESWRILQHYRMRVWPVLSTFLPFGIIAVCNITLVVSLRRSVITRRRSSDCSSTHAIKHARNSNKITATLLAVVFMYLLLVVPIEAMLYKNIFKHSWGYLVGKIFTILVALNFACNFLLYVMVNQKFRKIAMSFLRCEFKLETVQRRHSSYSSTRTTSLIARGSIEQQGLFNLSAKCRSTDQVQQSGQKILIHS